MSRFGTLGAMAVLLLCGSSLARAYTVDGILDPEYGPARSVQTTQSSQGDTPPSIPVFPLETGANSSELDGAFGEFADGALHLLFTGNFKSYRGEILTSADRLAVFIDCASGGQNPLRNDNTSASYGYLPNLAGLTFDSGFDPDFWFESAVDATGSIAYFAYMAALPSASGASGAFLGYRGAGAPGTLSNGVNPLGILSSIDQANRDGVDAGCGPASGAGTTTGIEWSIPLAAIGNPVGPIRVCAVLIATGGAFNGISNQVLGPLPPGTCALGAPASVNFANLPGDQFFVIDGTVPVSPTSWGHLKSRYR